MILGKFLTSPIELKSAVSDSTFNEARALECAIKKLSVNQRQNEDVFINRVNSDSVVLEKYKCVFHNPENFESLADVDFVLVD